MLIRNSDMAILTEYEGEKMLLDTKQYTLYLWHDSNQAFEEWFAIDCSTNLKSLYLFLNGEISAKDLIKEINPPIVKRNYDIYDYFDLLGKRQIDEQTILPSNNSNISKKESECIKQKILDVAPNFFDRKEISYSCQTL